MTFRAIVAAICVSLASATASFAAPVSFDFTASSSLTGGFVTGSFGYDTTGPITSSGTSFIRVDSGFVNFTITGDAYAGTHSLNSRATDLASRFFQMNAGPLGGTIVQLASSTADFTDFSKLPETLSLADADLAAIFSVLGVEIGITTPSRIDYDILTLTQTQFVVVTDPPPSIPLPAGGVLLLSGLVGVAALGRRKKHSA